MNTNTTKKEIVSTMSEKYLKLLTSLDWSDDLYIHGLREGLNKFLSNLHIKIAKLPKYAIADFYSDAALTLNESGGKGSLVFEHMVPKKKYIQDPCEEMARLNILTYEFIEKKLENYWTIAIITKEEDLVLKRSRMPEDWDYVDVFARYTSAKIKLNPTSLEISNRFKANKKIKFAQESAMCQ